MCVLVCDAQSVHQRDGAAQNCSDLLASRSQFVVIIVAEQLAETEIKPVSGTHNPHQP